MKNTVSLTKNHEFRRLYRKGASAASPSMVIYCRRNGANKKSGAARTVQNRLGLTVSTKLGNAVRRNRIRRRIREVYRLNEDSLKLGNDIVIVARAAAFDMPFWKMQKDFLRLCTKLGMARRDASKQIRHNR